VVGGQPMRAGVSGQAGAHDVGQPQCG
jgi:hypothetical protein